MRIYDPLYGPFTVPPYLAQLLMTPEVRRLSQIRLLNALSPSLAALGEVRRYSHTLGVLYLSHRVHTLGYTQDERKALVASVLLHDIGTPPFAHLFEYHLRDRTGWTHEGIIKSVLWGFHAPENRAHQFFAGQTIEFRHALERVGIVVELVEQIVTEAHPLSKLLFGSIDLDNLDNVARMAWALGLDRAATWAIDIATLMSVGRDGGLRLRRDIGAEPIARWAALRGAIYDILVFDPPTVAAQAILSEAIGIGIRDGMLSDDDWSLTDEELLDTLRHHQGTKDLIAREYLGRLPAMVFCVQIEGTLTSLGLSDRNTSKQKIEEVLRRLLPQERVLGYVFVDRGTFSKRLVFVDPNSMEEWSSGNTSTTVLFYGFVRSLRVPRNTQCRRAVDDLIEAIGVPRDAVVRAIVAPSQSDEYAQPSFDIASP
jgi:HD superfamily phosphohydrolase